MCCIACPWASVTIAFSRVASCLMSLQAGLLNVCVRVVMARHRERCVLPCSVCVTSSFVVQTVRLPLTPGSNGHLDCAALQQQAMDDGAVTRVRFAGLQLQWCNSTAWLKASVLRRFVTALSHSRCARCVIWWCSMTSITSIVTVGRR